MGTECSYFIYNHDLACLEEVTKKTKAPSESIFEKQLLKLVTVTKPFPLIPDSNDSVFGHGDVFIDLNRYGLIYVY